MKRKGSFLSYTGLFCILAAIGIMKTETIQVEAAKANYQQIVESASIEGNSIMMKLANSVVSLAAVAVPTTPIKTLEEETVPEDMKDPFHHEELKEINHDYVGMLFIPSLDLSYPVVLSHDNKEYLHKAFDGTKSELGCIFADKECDPFIERHTILYGHNMKDKSMFGTLKRFRTDSSLLDNPMIYIFSDQEVQKYKIFSFHVTDLHGTWVYQFPKSDRSLWEYQITAENSSELKISNDVYYLKILTLSTCCGDKTKRFVIHAGMVDRIEK